MGDVYGLFGSVNRIGACLGIVGGVSAVDRYGMFPKAWRDELGHQPVVVKLLPHLTGCIADLGRRQTVEIRHRVIIVELNRIEAEFLIHGQLVAKSAGRTYWWPKWISAFLYIPRAEREAIAIFFHSQPPLCSSSNFIIQCRATFPALHECTAD